MRLSYIIIVLAVFLVEVNSTEAFRIREWSQCGGLLEGEHGSFRHPFDYATPPPARDEAQDNHESLCIWVIYVPSTGRLTLKLEELEGSDPSLMLYPELNEVASTGRMQEVIHPTRLDSLAVGTATVLIGDFVVAMIRRSKTRSVAFRWDSIHVTESVHNVLNTLSFVQSPKGTLSFQPQHGEKNFVWILKDLRDPSMLNLTAKAADENYYCKTLEPDSIFHFEMYVLDSSSDAGRLVRSGHWITLGPSERPSAESLTSSPVAIITGGGWLAGNRAAWAGTELQLSWSAMENVTSTTTAEPATALTPEPEEVPTHIYFGSEEGLKAYDLVTSEVTVVMEGNITGVAYDPMSKKIFPYSSGKEGIIRRANMDGSGAEIIGSINSTAYGEVAGLTVDRSTGNLYVVTAYAFVLVCNTTRTPLTCVQIAHVEEAESPGSIALDTSTGRMYVKTNGPGKGKIWRGGMDGSCLVEIYPSIFFPRSGSQSEGALTFDPHSSKLYWAETETSRILVADKKRNFKNGVILDYSATPWGVAELNDRIYWTDATHKKLQSTHITDIYGDDIRTHHSDASQLSGLTLVKKPRSTVSKEEGRGIAMKLCRPALISVSSD